MKLRGLVLFLLTISLFIILTGCFKGEQSLEDIDPPQGAEAVDKSKAADDTDKASEEAGEESVASETVARQLYLVDVNGMVAPQTLELPKPESQEVAKQVLEYLVKGGPVTTILPNGFQAVLPEGTEILGLSLQEDGTMIVDVSKDFENYEAKDELKILEAMTHTLTQFDNVDRIKLWINGDPLDEMPVNGTPISEGYSRVNGINVMESDTVDLIDSKAVTMYYPAEHNDTRYYVPVTQHIEVEGEDLYQAIVKTLIDGPGYGTNMIHVFNTETMLMNNPTLDSGVLELVFNQSILKDSDTKDNDKSVISDEVMETLVRTLTEQQLVEAIDVKVENVNELVNENGEVYNEPVTKKSFIPVEKL